MERDDVKEVFKIIKSVYHQFEVNAEKIDIWHRLMKDQDAKRVMKATERYVLENKFPPTIAELRERKSEAHSQDFLHKVRRWEEEARASK